MSTAEYIYDSLSTKEKKKYAAMGFEYGVDEIMHNEQCSAPNAFKIMAWCENRIESISENLYISDYL